MRVSWDKVEERGNFKFIRLKSGRLVSFLDARHDAKRERNAMMRHVSRMFKLASDEWDASRVETFVEELDTYVGALRKELERLDKVRKARVRIAALRNTSGRTPEEAAAFNRKADELEERLKS